MTREGERAADRRAFAPSKQISRRFGFLWRVFFTYISNVMWLRSYERFLKVWEGTCFCVISLENIGGQRKQRRRIVIKG